MEGEKVVGMIMVRIDFPYEDNLFVQYVAIRPELQGKGIGGKLYEALKEECKTKRIYKVKAFINPDNPNSIKLHEMVGFKVADKREAILLIE